MFKKLNHIVEEAEAEHQSHISQWVKDRVKSGVPVTIKEWEQWIMNSYERHELYPLMDNECLKHTAQYFAGNCRPKTARVASCYDEALIHTLLPLLLDRIPDKP